MPDGQPSGEYTAQQLLLQAVQELRQEQRDTRQMVTDKLDEHGRTVSQILLELERGTGRMNGIDQEIRTVSAKAEENRQKLRGFETARYAKSDDSKPASGWISAKQLPAIIAAIAALIVAVVGLLRSPESPAAHAATAQTPPAAQPLAP